MSNNTLVFNAFSVTQHWDCLFLLWKCNILKHLNLVIGNSEWRGRLDLACDKPQWGITYPPPACAWGGQVCPGQNMNNQVMLYADASFVACNKGLLLPQPYQFLLVCACCSHGDVFQKLSVSCCRIMVLYCVGPILLSSSCSKRTGCTKAFSSVLWLRFWFG